MEIEIFIDYDNLLSQQKSKGIDYVASNILSKISNHITERTISTHIRIYGGWYDGSSPTKLSQDLSIEINNNFPKIIKSESENRIINFKVNAEIAKSLLEDPKTHLFNTFRKKSRPSNIRVEKPENVGCTQINCHLIYTRKILEKGKCSEASCCANSTPLVYRNEQKLVDTMLTCDLIYTSRLNDKLIIIVSDDDDFIPPLRSIVSSGKKVIRFNPKGNTDSKEIVISGSKSIEMGL